MAKWQRSVECVLDTGMEKSATSSLMCASLGGKCSLYPRQWEKARLY